MFAEEFRVDPVHGSERFHIPDIYGRFHHVGLCVPRFGKDCVNIPQCLLRLAFQAFRQETRFRIDPQLAGGQQQAARADCLGIRADCGRGVTGMDDSQ